MRAWFSGSIAAVLIAAPVLAAGGSSFATLLTNADRPAADKARDADRKPAELMAFGGIKAGSVVAELAPGGGYYTRLLSLAVGPKGHVYSNSIRPAAAVQEWAASHSNTTMVIGLPTEPLAPVPVDVVWTTLNYHDFKNAKRDNGDAAGLYNKAAFAALKPGGVYLINDHYAATGAGASQTATLHRIEDKIVISEVEAAGFKLQARSDMLRHAADDHTIKVLETGIRGKTDQFVLRFRKPKTTR